MKDVKFLKEVYNVRTDAELGDKMGVSIEAIRGWKKRGVPSKVKLEEMEKLQFETFTNKLSDKEVDLVEALRKLPEVNREKIYHLVMFEYNDMLSKELKNKKSVAENES